MDILDQFQSVVHSMNTVATCFKFENEIRCKFFHLPTPTASTSHSSHTWLLILLFTFIEKYCSHFLLLRAPHENARDNVLMTTMLSEEKRGWRLQFYFIHKHLFIYSMLAATCCKCILQEISIIPKRIN